MHADVLIIGAGAAGLTAARVLGDAGLSVRIIEGRDRIGGRIHTIYDPTFPLPVELGAEFVHGLPKESWKRLRNAKLTSYEINADHWWAQPPRLQRLEDFWGEFAQVTDQLKRNRPDQSFADFMKNCCRGNVTPRAKQLALAYVEGFNAADSGRISVNALIAANKASEKIEGDRLFRVMQGYGALVQHMAAQLDPQRVRIQLNTVVKRVEWSSDGVNVSTVSPQKAVQEFNALFAVVTLPLGVLKAPRSATASVVFDPPLDEKLDAMAQMEMGPVIKVTFLFREPFWEKLNRNALEQMAFIHSRDPYFPTWWSFLPMRSTMLTAWSGGPPAERMSRQSPDRIRDRAIQSLSKLLGVTRARIAQQIQAWHVYDWQADAFSLGAYSYLGVGGEKATQILARPMGNALFFAGEATDSEMSGTVAGAIASGERAGREVLLAKRKISRTRRRPDTRHHPSRGRR